MKPANSVHTINMLPARIACGVRRLLMCSAWLLVTVVSAETTYRWIDADTGRTVLSDMPPPAGAKRVIRYSGSQAGEESALPYAVRQASEKFPVVLYTSPGCTTCKDARALLEARGAPYTETVVKTDEELAELGRRIGGESALPAVTVGRQSARGFSATVWNGLLDAAGYPSRPPYRPRPAAAPVP